MRKLLRDRKGALSVLLIGLLFCLLLLTFLAAETGSVYYRYSQTEDILQRAANSAVESNIQDRYRSDRELRLDTASAQRDFRTYAMNDLPEDCSLNIRSLRADMSPPALTVTGTVTFRTVFSLYGFRDVTCPFRVRSRNFDLH